MILILDLFFLQQQANPPDNDSLFTVKGLEPRIDDLENINIFDDSSDETEGVSEFLYVYIRCQSPKYENRF